MSLKFVGYTYEGEYPSKAPHGGQWWLGVATAIDYPDVNLRMYVGTEAEVKAEFYRRARLGQAVHYGKGNIVDGRHLPEEGFKFYVLAPCERNPKHKKTLDKIKKCAIA